MDEGISVNCSFEDTPMSPSTELPLGKPSQEAVCELYQKLVDSGNPQISTDFEGVISSILTDFKEVHQERDRLEKSYEREKDKYDTHLRSLERDMEEELQRMESRVRTEEQVKFETRREELRKNFDDQMQEMQQNLTALQKQQEEQQKRAAEAANTENDTELRSHMNDVAQDNRKLQSDVTETKTALALLRSDLIQTRQVYEEKCRELEYQKSAVYDYIKEQDNLTRQLHMLHDANRRLQDANDDLRGAIEQGGIAAAPQTTGMPTSGAYALSADAVSLPGRSRPTSRPSSNAGSAVSDRLLAAAPSPHLPNNSVKTESIGAESNNLSLADEINQSKHTSADDEAERLERDSGHSTLRELHDLYESELELPGFVRPVAAPSFTPVTSRGYLQTDAYPLHTSTPSAYSPQHPAVLTAHTADLSQLDPSQLGEVDHHHLAQLRETTLVGSDPAPSTHRPSADSASNSDDPEHIPTLPKRTASLRRARTPQMQSRRTGKTPSFRAKRNTATNATPAQMTEPERMFKIVMAGDAAVGKSSFILRLCKDKFYNNLTSTLGVDFQTKLMEVDGRCMALQLWDTAGQERFRSIAKSYFRRADGILLLYDCSYERSFINVREWIQSIEESQESTSKVIPMMLVANKTDVRDDPDRDTSRRYITQQEGQDLAREFDALFIETSAKDGKNISESVVELTRLLRATQDMEVQSVGLQLTKTDQKESKCCSAL